MVSTPIVSAALLNYPVFCMMPTEIMIATVLFTLALVLYSIAIWSGRKARQIKLWQVAIFFSGVSADALGVWITVEFIGAIVLTPHAIFGFTALILMSLHFLWVLFIYIANQTQTRHSHRFSLLVWSVWVLSYLSGLVTGLQKVL